MISKNEEFYKRLTEEEKTYFKLYKENDECFAYNLNNVLREKKTLPQTFSKAVIKLDSLITKYASECDLILYRACDDNSVKPFIMDDAYINPEYLSTTQSKYALKRHFSNCSDPVLVIFIIKSNTNIAPMESNVMSGGLEHEFLLGRNNRFSVEERNETNKKEIEGIMGKFYAEYITNLKVYMMKNFK